MKIKSRVTNILSVLLICCIIVVQPSIVQASSSIQQNSNDQFSLDITNSSEYTNDALKQIYNELSDEAKFVFLDYMIKYDNELYSYHLENVVGIDSSIVLSSELPDLNALNLDAERALNAANALSTLSNNLNQIMNLPQDVYYALMGVGSSIVAYVGSLGSTTVASLLLGGGCLIVLMLNWSTVEALWPQIVQSFQTAFNTTPSTTITSGFSTARARYIQDYSKNQDATALAFISDYTGSATRHVDYASSRSIFANRGNRYRIYSSHYTSTAMVVIDIGAGVNADISDSLASTFLSKQPVSGGKLYALYNLETHKYFHMHIKVIGDDTHALRQANGLCYQIWPGYSYDPQYDHSQQSLYISTDAWNKPLK